MNITNKIKFYILVVIALVAIAMFSTFFTTNKRFLLAATQVPTQSPTVTKALHALYINSFGENFGSIIWVGWRPRSGDIAILYEQDTSIRILDANTGKLKLVIQPPTVIGGITSIGWSPDGKYLACSIVTSPNAIYIWDLSLNVLKDPLVLHHIGQQASFSWFPNSHQLVSVGAFGQYQGQWKLFVWDITQNKPITELEASDNPIVKVFVSPDGKTLAAFTRNGEGYSDLQLRDTTNFKIVKMLQKSPIGGETTFISGEVSWSSDGTKLVGTLCAPITGACYVWVWNITDDQVSQPTLTNQQVDASNITPFISSALSPDGNSLATNTASGAIFIWDIITDKLVSYVDESKSSVTSFSWSPDSTMLAISKSDGSVGIWKVH